MEASRLNIMMEKSPTVIFTNRGQAFLTDIKVKQKGQLEVDVEVLGQRLDMDENGNEVMKYTLGIIKAKPLNIMRARHDATDRKRV